MSVESSAEAESRQARSRRARFREWRNSRPFAGGVLLCLAGLVIGWVPMQFAFELMLVGGSYTFIGLTWAIGVFLTGAFVLYRPDLSTILGVIGVVLSFLSLLGALGGLLLGMIIGIVGGNLCVAWSAPETSGSGRDGERRPVRTDGGTEPDRSGRTESSEPNTGLAGLIAIVGSSGPLSRLRSDGGVFGTFSRGASLDRVRRLARRTTRNADGSFLRAKSPAAPGRVVDAATSGGSSKRLAVAFALLVATTGTLTLVSTIPAAALFGDDEQTTYTVDVGEIQLGDGGQICAASVGSDTYHVTITNATLVDTTIYQQRGDDAVRTEFPTLQVEDTMVMETSSQNDRLDLLATTLGCTEEDQTSRTVFRNQFQTSSLLRSSEGVTMQTMEPTDAAIPEAGGFQFIAPDDNGTSQVGNVTDEVGNVTDEVGNVTDGVEEVADGIDDVVNGTLEDRLLDDTGDPGVLNETVENATSNATNATDDVVSSVDESVENTTREATDSEPPENVTGAVDGTTDVVDNTTREVTGTTDDVASATDETVTGDSNGTVSEVVDGATDVVDNTTRDVTGGVDATTEQVVSPTEEAETSTEDAETPSEETVTPTDTPVTPTEIPATPTDDGLLPTGDGSDDRPGWLDRADDDEGVLQTIEETEGTIDDVANVTAETRNLSEETIVADDNLTALDNGTVLLLNGTDSDDVDWAPDLPLGTDSPLFDDDETEAKDESEPTGTDSGDDAGDDSGGSLAGAAG